MTEPSPEVRQRAAAVRFVLLDADGVLTDGRLHLGSRGFDGRSFHVHDGAGVRLGQRGGLHFGVLSGRESAVVAERAAELYITEVHQGVYDKLERFNEIVERTGIEPTSVCYVGDDVVDLPVLRRVGFAVAPADAIDVVRDSVHYVTRRGGGRGAVREVIDLILACAGKLDQATERFLR